MFDRRLLHNFDWGLLGLTLLLSSFGLFILYSAVSAETPAPQKIIFLKQLIWFGCALVAMAAGFSFNYKLLDRWGQPLYLVCILLLVYVLFFGKYIGGSIIGPVSIQPSELMKIAIIIALARYYSKDANTRGYTLRELIKPFALTMIPFVLIVKQPDLGTAGLLLLIACSITIFVKIERRSLIYLFVSCAAVIPLVWFFLKEYQKRRILVFLDPDRDPLGSGLIFWGLNIAQGCREPFGTIMAVGITSMIFWQVIINIGMTMGLMPVVGVPLPFISYGGSSVLTTAIGIGLLMNVSMRRFQLE